MKEETIKAKSGTGETIRTIIYAVLIAVVIRTFAYEPFKIPSESMLPTLMIGDYLFVSKFSYGYSRHSFPFSIAPISGRIFADLPERGDVAVFKKPIGEPVDYIKRIMGLPGDKLQMINGVLNINGEPVKREKVEDFVDRDRFGNIRRVAQYRETLDSGRTYLTLDETVQGLMDNTDVYTVPEGHVFAMGDNRDNSTDSRFLNHVGYIPVENLVGRAEILFMSLDGSAEWYEIWKYPMAIRWSRIFTPLS
ncbi:signal peptidase I [Sneathiella sp.]|uniref:signal peptidase I n=1 Tax=Sneathiella sp. TaxID=1964365 RepID=UPI0035687FF6